MLIDVSQAIAVTIPSSTTDTLPGVYYVSIAFGVVSFFCACCLGDISKYMDDHVAVVIH